MSAISMWQQAADSQRVTETEEMKLHGLEYQSGGDKQRAVPSISLKAGRSWSLAVSVPMPLPAEMAKSKPHWRSTRQLCSFFLGGTKMTVCQEVAEDLAPPAAKHTRLETAARILRQVTPSAERTHTGLEEPILMPMMREIYLSNGME